MLIVCPSCASEYTIDPAKLGADGRTLRCAICRDTWFVASDGQPAQPPPESAEAQPRNAPLAVKERPAGRRMPVRLGFAAAGLAALLLAGGMAFPNMRHGLGQRMAAGVRSLAHPVGKEHAELEFRAVTSELVPH